MRLENSDSGGVARAESRSRTSIALRQLIAWLGASRLRFVLVFAATLVLAYNVPFWYRSHAAVGTSAGGLAFLAALAAMLISVHALLMLLVPGRRTPAVLAAALLISASLVLY